MLSCSPSAYAPSTFSPTAVLPSARARSIAATLVAIVAGAKAVALTVLDIATTPQLVADAKDYFQNVQLKDQKYDPVLAPTDQPAIHLNAELMSRMRPQMEPFYYDSKKYPTYLDQLGIKYPR